MLNPDCPVCVSERDGCEGDGHAEGVGVGGEAFKRVEQDGRRRWKWLKAQAKPTNAAVFGNDRSRVSPSPSNKEQTNASSDHGRAPGAGQAESGAPGLTRSCFALSCGSAAVCKVEKKPRKTKVYECLNSPVAC